MSEDKAKEMISDIIANAVIKAFKKAELDRIVERIKMETAFLLDEIEELEEKIEDIKDSLMGLDSQITDMMAKRLELEVDELKRHVSHEPARKRAEKLFALRIIMAIEALEKITTTNLHQKAIEATKALEEVEKRWKEMLKEEPEEVRTEVKRILAQLQAIAFK